MSTDKPSDQKTWPEDQKPQETQSPAAKEPKKEAPENPYRISDWASF